MVKVKGNINPNLLLALVGAVVLLVLVVVFRRRIGRALGIGGASTSSVDADYFQAVGQQIDALQSEGIRPTYSPENYESMAESIYNALQNITGIGDNKREAVRIMQLQLNDLDIQLLTRAFGIRREHIFGVFMDKAKNLSQFLTDNLSRDQIEAINSDYASKGIGYRY